MKRYVGTVTRGIRSPIVREGDVIEELVVNCVLKASETEGFSIRDRDIVGITESVVARAQGNYASVDAIAADLTRKFGSHPPPPKEHPFHPPPPKEYPFHSPPPEGCPSGRGGPPPPKEHPSGRGGPPPPKECPPGRIHSPPPEGCPSGRGGALGVVFPILSRNRFAILLKAMARSTRQVILQLSFPADEVGNQLIDQDKLDDCGINPWTDCLTEDRFREYFGSCVHPFTGIDYLAYFRSLVEAEGAACTILLSNQPQTILAYTRQVLACDIHSRARTKRVLLAEGGNPVYSLDDIMASSVNGSGYHPDYGLLGSNKSSEESVKLFPREGQSVVDRIQQLFMEKTGKAVEVMIYGDGAFKDPVGMIWELADPVVSPAYTTGLTGTPQELKIKYLADNQFAGLTGEALQEAIEKQIQSKRGDLTGTMEAQGTTPRRLTDLIGSLCDLTSGSGDKGTPIVYIQGYFDSFATE